MCMTHDTANDPGIHCPKEPHSYQIVVAGHLDMKWADWFDGVTLTHTPDGHTHLDGVMVDQSALLGVIKRINGLGLTLISVNPQDLQNKSG